jgi:hypothetical protein
MRYGQNQVPDVHGSGGAAEAPISCLRRTRFGAFIFGNRTVALPTLVRPIAKREYDAGLRVSSIKRAATAVQPNRVFTAEYRPENS